MTRLHRLACALFAALALTPAASGAVSIAVVDDGDLFDVAAHDISVFAGPFTQSDATFTFSLTASTSSKVHVAFDAAFLGRTSAAVAIASGPDDAFAPSFNAASPTLGFSFDLGGAATRQVSLVLSDVLGLGLTPQLSFRTEQVSVTPIAASAPYLAAALLAFSFLRRQPSRR